MSNPTPVFCGSGIKITGTGASVKPVDKIVDNFHCRQIVAKGWHRLSVNGLLSVVIDAIWHCRTAPRVMNQGVKKAYLTGWEIKTG